ncbi:ABC-type nickel/cobalt efflux system permease component RcnA [Comamonas sp. BIGb0152]|uniref:hypothetical protein n=1 Tax=Comamonas sp. BIGb0152 TaxID=2940601 RepID=UPI0021699AED|nr:hypothetical protein [Comamonas sp. BIGb0152]MCS4291933.1 ABC-type nickel/cobalt efflux system permease component RcnA [Comamonas sp. BIGb0152]
MSKKSESGCLTVFIVLACLSLLGKYISIKYVLLGVGLWMIFSWLRNGNQRRKSKQDEQDAAQAAEDGRIAHRDADTQTEPYQYNCVGHPNVTLAIRYGIANLKREPEECSEDEEQIRNSIQLNPTEEPADSILLRKIRRIDKDRFLAELPEFGNRKVVVVIEQYSESVKTFYPLDESWFKRHAEFERTLKDNRTFTLKELAKFHVEKTIPGA